MDRYSLTSVNWNLLSWFKSHYSFTYFYFPSWDISAELVSQVIRQKVNSVKPQVFVYHLLKLGKEIGTKPIFLEYKSFQCIPKNLLFVVDDDNGQDITDNNQIHMLVIAIIFALYWIIWTPMVCGLNRHTDLTCRDVMSLSSRSYVIYKPKLCDLISLGFFTCTVYSRA